LIRPRSELDDTRPSAKAGHGCGDSAKAISNIAKHGVSFFEAATVFVDLAIYLDDGSGAGVLVVIGMSLRERVL